MQNVIGLIQVAAKNGDDVMALSFAKRTATAEMKMLRSR